MSAERPVAAPPSSPDPAAPVGQEPAATPQNGASASRAERIRSGSMTALLQEIAAIPEDELGKGWSLWLSPGAVVGRFEMVREIGRGGFGVVWEARDRQLGRRVAFKAVRAGGKASLREERLLSEAEAAAKLSHPNIVTIHDVGRAEQGPYLVLELIEGETLEERLARGPLPVLEAVRTALEIAKGVAHAHAQGVVHRDLKPANVALCKDGRVKVLDFGMAHAFGRRREEGGTPAYMAPEQSSGAPEDERTDVFALGAILFQMLSGELPFAAGAGGASRSWSTPYLEVGGQPALGELVSRMLEKDPTRRPRDGEGVVEELTELHRALELSTSSTSLRVRTRRRSPLRVALPVAAGILLGAALTAFAMWRGTHSAPTDDGRIVVAVADFANETRDPDLDGLSGLLITSLEQSKKLRVLTRGRLIDLVREMGEGDAPHIDESLARAVGKKAGVRTLLLASIQKLGDTYAAELRAVDPQKDEYLFTVREQATAKNELLPLIDRMSDRTRLALREPDADVKASEVNVGEAVTGNLEAYRHYFRGKELAARNALGEAVVEFRKALEIEPHFPLAQAETAWIGYSWGAVSAKAAKELLHEASRDAARAPGKEAGIIRILAAFFDGRFSATRAEIRSLVARYPDDPDVAVVGAEILYWAGYFEESAPAFDRALRLAPEWDFLRFDQVWVLAALGKADEARRLAEDAERARDTPAARAVVGVARYMAGDVEGGVAALRTSGANDALFRAFLAQGLAAQGRIDDALAAVAPFENATGDTTRAQVLAYGGRLREGLATLDVASRRPGDDVAFNRQTAARYLAAAGDPSRARKMADQGTFFMWLDGVMLANLGDERRMGELVGQMQADSLFYPRLLRAVAAHRAGASQKALAELRELDKGSVSFVPYFHGLVAAESGHDEEAVEAFRRFERPAFWASDAFEAPWFRARARFLMARSLDRLGRRWEARTVLDHQLEVWKQADPDLPLLAEMKALRAKL